MFETFISAERQIEFRAALRWILSSPDLGPKALSNSNLMFNTLLDLLPDAQLERNILRAAIENGVAEQMNNLIAAQIPAETAIRLATESLATRTGLTPESCAWISREIAAALGLATMAEDSPPALAEVARQAETPATPAPPTIAAAETVIAPTPAWSATPPAPPLPGRSRKPLMIVVAVVIALAVAGTVTGVLISSHPKSKPVAVKPAVRVYRLTSKPFGVTVAGPAAWIAEIGPDRVQELNVSNGRPGVSGTSGLDGPVSVAAGDGFVWAVNVLKPPGSVAQFSAKTGQLIRTLGTASQIENPQAVAVLGNTVWVANLGTRTATGFTGYGSVTELNAATGAVIRTIKGSGSGITYPSAITVSGPYVWVADGGYRGGLGGVTRIDSRSGTSWTKSSGTPANAIFERPAAIAASGSRVWVLNTPYRGPISLTELNASDGTYINRWSGSQYDFGNYIGSFGFRPQGVAAAGNRVWVVNPHGGSDGLGSVTEINGRTGAVIRVLSGGALHFDDPSAVTATGSAVWIANTPPPGTPGSVTVLYSFR